MEVSVLGHAGLAVRARGALVLVDPWFAPSGAFNASWFVYPDNLHLADEFLQPDAVAISHEHCDHLDPWFLARLPMDVPVYIPRYPSLALRNKLEEAGRKLILSLEDGERREVAPGIGLRFVCEESPMHHDAAVVLDTPTGNVVDLNDARLFPMQVREIRNLLGGSIDVLTLQCAGASWYPVVYDYRPERMHELCQDKRVAKLTYAAAAMAAADASHVVPIGGPPCFLDPALAHHNAQMEGGIFSDQHQVAEWLREHDVPNVHVLLPGESIDVAAGEVLLDERWADFWSLDRHDYLAAYAERRREAIEEELARFAEPEGSLHERFDEYGRKLVSLNAYCNERVGMRVGFDITGPGGGQWHIDFRAGEEPVGTGLDDCGYVLQLESRWLEPILSGRLPWEDFFLSLRFRARRDPDLYNDHLLGVFKFADADALDAVEAHELAINTEDRIHIVTPDGQWRSVSRWCPHAGSDLREVGEVQGDVLQCLTHNYRFDLTTGECQNSRCKPLEVELLDEVATGGAPSDADAAVTPGEVDLELRRATPPR